MSESSVAIDLDSLITLAAGGRIDELEAGWNDAIESQPSARKLISVVNALAREHRGRAAPLLNTALEAYQAAKAHGDAIDVIRALVPLGSRNAELGEAYEQAVRAAHKGEEWLDLFAELSGLGGDDDVEDIIDRFDRLAGLLPGRVVYHRSGWGEGLVLRIRMSDQSMVVRFREDGMERDMPFTTGLDVLTSLDPEDLRARLLTDIDGLKEQAESAPALLVRAVVEVSRGKAASKDVKNWLEGPVIEKRSWASWWKKAKTAAVHDPYLRVDNPSRPVFELRKVPLSAVQELGEAVARTNDLKGVLDVVRGPLTLDPSPEMMAALLGHLGTALDEAGEMGLVVSGKEISARLEALMLLVRHEARPVEDLCKLLDGLVTEKRRFFDVVEHLSGAGARRESLDAFIKARPELWSDDVLDDLGRMPAPLLTAVAGRLVESGRGPALANRFHIFLISPSKQPIAVLRLAREFGDGLFEGIEEAPAHIEVVMGLLHLAETQAPKASRGDKPAKEVMRELGDVLLRRKGGLLAAFVDQAPRPSLEAAVSLLARCSGMPDEIDTEVHRLVENRFPGLVPRDEIPFWETGGIYCTHAGLARRNKEYRVLIDEKIPENSETIGKAASYGDLSENFEWTSAIEQQRQLTEKAAAMEAELKVAQAIEDQELPEGIVVPGSRVTYKEGGKSKTITILGPWDLVDGVISYLAPVAAGMLGAQVGETATLKLPSGDVDVEILKIEAVVESTADPSADD